MSKSEKLKSLKDFRAIGPAAKIKITPIIAYFTVFILSTYCLSATIEYSLVYEILQKLTGRTISS